MKKINRISNVGFIKINKGSTYKGSYNRVKEKDSVFPVSNSSASDNNSSNNKLVNFDMYYDHMQDQKPEYKKFYKDEQELEDNVRKLDDKDKNLLDILISCVDSYNNSIISLKEFDKSFDTNHAEVIISLITDYKYALEDIGIKLLSDGQLLIYKKTLKKVIDESPDSISFIIGNDYGLFYKIYKTFQNVKISSSKNSKYESSKIQGNIIDEKC